MTRTIVALFDTTAEAEQAAEHLALDVGGVRGEVYDSGRASGITSMSIPSEDTALVREGIRRGGAVVYAEVPEEKVEAVAAILEADGAVDFNEREAAWRREGWTGSSATGTAGTATGTPVVTGDDTAVTATTTTGTATATSGSARQNLGTPGGEEVIPLVEERLRVGKQETSHGRVRIRSHVVETPVEEQVTLREEHVQVERRPADRPVGAADDAAFGERTIEATETSEEAVVSKEARVREEVVVRKTAEDRTETVQDTVRRTEVDVEEERGRANPAGPGTPRRDNV
jgi:uncharacterized protein (TIGR02271 family)